MLFSMLLSFFVINKRGEGSIVGHICGRSQNVPKNIGICPGIKTSNLGINKTRKNPENYIKNQENQQII